MNESINLVLASIYAKPCFIDELRKRGVFRTQSAEVYDRIVMILEKDEYISCSKKDYLRATKKGVEHLKNKGFLE